MQIVEYLYATLFGNDLHPRFEFLSTVPYPRMEEYHLSVEPRKIFPLYISSIYLLEWKFLSIHWNTVVSRGSSLTRFFD